MKIKSQWKIFRYTCTVLYYTHAYRTIQKLNPNENLKLRNIKLSKISLPTVVLMYNMSDYATLQLFKINNNIIIVSCMCTHICVYIILYTHFSDSIKKQLKSCKLQ